MQSITPPSLDPNTEADQDTFSRQEALAVLELVPTASPEQIEKRYELLVRRYRHARDASDKEALARINAAYAALNPQPLPDAWQPATGQPLVLGKSLAYWKNWLYYTRWTILAIAAGLAFVIYLITTMVTNRPADFKILLIGEYFLASENISQDEVFGQFEDSVVEILNPLDPEINRVSFEWIQLGFAEDGSLKESVDIQFQQANVMKALAQLSSEDYDVILMSRGAYANYAAQADFVDLAPLLIQLDQRMSTDVRARLESLMLHPADSDQTSVTGLDVTALDPLAGLSILGEPLVVTVGPRSPRPDLAIAWLVEWLDPA